MKLKIILIFSWLFFFVKPIESFAQVNVQDSLALVDFYDSTYGVNWLFVRWNLNEPISQWEGIRVENNRVTGIELRGACRSGRIPSSFGNLTALTSIYLLDCKLTEATLPASFSNLINLTSLKMSAVFWHLPFPVSIFTLPKLTYIDFQDNLFTDAAVPASLGNMIQLKHLDLSRCFSINGGSIPPELGKLKNLQSLYLTENNLTDTIPDSFANLESLEYLDISGNKLSGPIPTAINSLENLNYLFANNNKFTFQAIEPYLLAANSLNKTYIDLVLSPQANIIINRHHEKIAVSAGGTLSNNTFKWYKTGNGLVATKNGDSTYTPVNTGNYYVEVTNSVASDFILKSNTINYNYLLAENNTTIEQYITGTDTTYINDGFFKVASIKPIAGANALTGDVSTSVTIDAVVSTFNSQPYVQRHYDISPSENAENAQAIITLYFTQQDFDNYNSYVTANNLNYPLLPTGGVNNGNVRITQFHGSFTASPDPGNYNTGDKVLISPSVAWDPLNHWWILTFPVKGFSGFFVNTGNSALPLSLLDFRGAWDQNNVKLQWFTTNETSTREFIVQNSSDGIHFYNTGTLKAASTTGKNSYQFIHTNPSEGIQFYRLKMMDIDGQYTFSKVIRINSKDKNVVLKIYPNPVTENLHLKIVSAQAERTLLSITDASGKLVYQKSLSVNAGTTLYSVDVEKLPAGAYYLKININGKLNLVSFIRGSRL